MLVTRESCDWEGNPDLYGIGVRAGLYAQWTATLLATVFDQRSEGVLRITNRIIQFAIFIGLCTESTKSGNAVGSVITQFLLCGSLSSVTGDGITNLNKVSGLMRIIFYMALSAYGCWFWFTGVDAMTQTSCRHIAFFGRASFTGWFRSLGKALSVMELISCVCLCGVCGFFVYKRFRGGLAGLHEDRKRPRVDIVLMLLSMGLIAFSVAIVEYLISVNEPKGEITTTVSSVGQLIPLIAGTMACGMMLWRVVAGGLMWKKRCWFLIRCHL
ncbi:hypothetical protein K4F52_003524 [Lecanicillium sp. MT-2017a]|nr:hypothetical protein K4F52_003524 [Lecanicillium sp. MT-2017a]